MFFHLLRLIHLSLFLIAFQLYRIVFAMLPRAGSAEGTNLEGDEISGNAVYLTQSRFTVTFGLLKLAFKQGAIKLVEMGNNPDMGPFCMFFYDAIAALSANILFMDLASSEAAANVTSQSGVGEGVWNMIMIDILENMYQAFQVLFLVKRFQKIKLRLEKHQQEVRLERIERRLNFTQVKKKVGMFNNSPLRSRFGSTNDEELSGSDDDEVDRWLHGANKSDLADAQRGADQVYMNKAVRRVLLIVAAEASEVRASEPRRTSAIISN